MKEAEIKRLILKLLKNNPVFIILMISGILPSLGRTRQAERNFQGIEKNFQVRAREDERRKNRVHQ